MPKPEKDYGFKWGTTTGLSYDYGFKTMVYAGVVIGGYTTTVIHRSWLGFKTVVVSS